MKVYVYIAFTLLLLGLGVFVGYKVFSPQAQSEKVIAQTILQELRDEGFLITQSVISNQQATIDRNSGSAFKDFFWGQDIEARATLKVGSGVRLSGLTTEDVVVTGNQVQVHLPRVEHYSTEIIGDVTLKNRQGILKKIFDNDNGYNTAATLLKELALKSADDPALLLEAQNSAKQELVRLVHLLAPNREVVVAFK